MKYYLGIDLGTSSIKISLGNEKGEIVDSATRDYPLLLPKINYSEQNPIDWYNALIECFKELKNKHDFKDIQALSFSGQMHGLVLLDENDEVIRPAILWNDSRTIDEVDYLNNVIGKDKLIKETGNIALCGFTAPKILWVKKHEKENFNRIKKIMLPKDYLAYKLSGVFASDISDLSGTLFFDVKNRKYSKFMLDILEIDDTKLPEIRNSFDVIGTIKTSFVEEFGFNSSTKVVIGGGDQAVGAIGTNTIKEGEISISLGTSGVVFGPSKSYTFDKEGEIHSFRHADGNFHLMGCTLSAMASLKWFLEDILETHDFVKELSNIPEEISEIIFLPYLCGERSPINDPNARGIFANLSSFYKRSDLVKAVLEGIAFSLYDVYCSMEKNGVKAPFARIIGGGTKSKEVIQLISDVFGLPMHTISTNDGGALGAIILAMVGDELYPSVSEASSQLIKDKDIYLPNEEKHKLYLDKFRKYKELYFKNKN